MPIGYPCLRGVNFEMWDLNLLTSSTRHLNIGDLADDLTTVCGAFFSRSSLMKSGFSCIKRYAPPKFKMEPGKGSWMVILLLDKGLVGFHCFMVGLAEGNLEHPVIEIQNPNILVIRLPIWDINSDTSLQFGVIIMFSDHTFCIISDNLIVTYPRSWWITRFLSLRIILKRLVQECCPTSPFLPHFNRRWQPGWWWPCARMSSWIKTSATCFQPGNGDQRQWKSNKYCNVA